jgi:hypothetical protein
LEYFVDDILETKSDTNSSFTADYPLAIGF